MNPNDCRDFSVAPSSIPHYVNSKYKNINKEKKEIISQKIRNFCLLNEKNLLGSDKKLDYAQAEEYIRACHEAYANVHKCNLLEFVDTISHTDTKIRIEPIVKYLISWKKEVAYLSGTGFVSKSQASREGPNMCQLNEKAISMANEYMASSGIHPGEHEKNQKLKKRIINAHKFFLRALFAEFKTKNPLASFNEFMSVLDADKHENKLNTPNFSLQLLQTKTITFHGSFHLRPTLVGDDKDEANDIDEDEKERKKLKQNTKRTSEQIARGELIILVSLGKLDVPKC